MHRFAVGDMLRNRGLRTGRCRWRVVAIGEETYSLERVIDGDGYKIVHPHRRKDVVIRVEHHLVLDTPSTIIYTNSRDYVAMEELSSEDKQIIGKELERYD
jgi:hypothetical protein